MQAALLAVSLGVILAAAASSGCNRDCAPTGPSGPAVLFAGPLPAGGSVFHDVPVPSSTHSVDVFLQWTPSDARLRLLQIDSNCDPTQNANCPMLLEPREPRPGSPQDQISAYMSHQGENATGRVRFVIQNVSNLSANYSATATPKRHGCER